MENRIKPELSNGGEGARAALPRAMDGVRRADDRLVTFVKERPLVAIGAALALGYVLGRVATRIG
jgi:hypothetical protein